MDYTKTGPEILVAQFNIDNPTFSLTTADVTFGEAGVNGLGDSGIRDTSVLMTAVAGSGYKGALTLTYNRLNLATLVSETSYQVGTSTHVSDIVALINAAQSLNLIAGVDYTDADLPAFNGGDPQETKTFTLEALASSKIYKGSVTITLTAGEIDLSEANGQLSGLA